MGCLNAHITQYKTYIKTKGYIHFRQWSIEDNKLEYVRLYYVIRPKKVIGYVTQLTRPI